MLLKEKLQKQLSRVRGEFQREKNKGGQLFVEEGALSRELLRTSQTESGEQSKAERDWRDVAGQRKNLEPQQTGKKRCIAS